MDNIFVCILFFKYDHPTILVQPLDGPHTCWEEYQRLS